MEHTEIPQQEKQGIFETAKLKTIIPKTPEEEERIENIRKQIIDIEKYRDTIHLTQVTNISSILREGLLPNSLSKFGYRGLKSHYSEGIFLTTMHENSSFRKWVSIPWKEAGSIIIMFHNENLKQILWEENITLLDHLAKRRLMHKATLDIETVLSPADSNDCHIPKEAIKGIIINPCEKFQLEISEQKKIFLTPKQIAESASIQLTRLFYKKPNAHFVPLYDHLGNVLWPEKIPYQEVQRIVSQEK